LIPTQEVFVLNQGDRGLPKRDDSGRNPHVPQTKYLHAKLEHGPKPTPKFSLRGFRSLEGEDVDSDPAVEEQPLVEVLLQDEELGHSFEETRRLYRVIGELEVAELFIQSELKRFSTADP